MGNVTSFQVCDPSGAVCVGDGSLTISGLGLSVGFDISGCTESISVGPDATTFTTVCPGVTSTAIISGVNSGDGNIMAPSNDLSSGFELNPPSGSGSGSVASGTGLPSMFMGIPMVEYQRQLTESLKRTFLTDELVSIIIHRPQKTPLTINIARKSTVSDVKRKLNIPLSVRITWKGHEMENHYPIGYFVTEPVLHLTI